MALIGMEYGIGRHIYYLPRDDGILATKLDWLCQAFFIAALTGGKISVAFLILRISNTKWHTYFLHTINIALLIINLPLIVWTYCQCRPTAALWDPAVKGECQEPKLQGGFAVFQGCMSLLSSRQSRPPSKRITCGSFTPGKTSSASCMSPAPIYHPANASSVSLDEATSLLIWYNTEMYVIIIAGSLPTLRPLFQKSILSRPFFARQSSKGYLSHNGDYGLHVYPNNKKRSMRGGSSTRNGDRSSDQEILADGITKTVEVDYTVSDASMEPPTPGCRTKRREMWEDVEAGCKALRENGRL
ncbi:MAG: hypothetical protein Q9185_001277 [Variospora sp. 1 TL-2023]